MMRIIPKELVEFDDRQKANISVREPTGGSPKYRVNPVAKIDNPDLETSGCYSIDITPEEAKIFLNVPKSK